MQSVVADRAARKVLTRLLPFTMLLLFFNLLDRSSISYAALQMNRDFGFGPAVYGVAAGIFSLGSFLFEIPSNLILVRVGARRWIARIMISWGVVVICIAWINGETSLYVLRFILGVAEAGLLPGVMYFLSFWVPAAWRGLALSMLMSTTALSNVLGGPLATGLMELDGLFGLRGWQWVFVMEGVPTMILGGLTLRWLPDKPALVAWLTLEEKAHLDAVVAAEREFKNLRGASTLRQGFLDPRLLLITLVGFFFVCCNYGTVFWLPQIIKAFGGLTDMQVGLTSSVPYLIGGLGTVLWGRHSDRTGDRKWHLVAGALVGAAGYAWAASAPDTRHCFAGLCVATLGIWSMFGVFWALAGDFLAGAAAAAGMAVINSFAVLGGFVGPVLIGYLRERSDNFAGSFAALACLALVTALLALLLRNYGREVGSPRESELPPIGTHR